MQKVIRRTLLAEKQAARRLARQKAKDSFDWLKTNRENTRYVRSIETGRIQEAKRERREDWELGPLAPRRDVGDNKDKYGTVDQNLMRGPELPFKDRDEILKAVGGKGRLLHFREGDNVVLIEGRDKGKIGKILKIDKDRAECQVEGLNMVDVPMPSSQIHKDDPNQSLIRSMEKPVPLTSIRLVLRIRGEKGVRNARWVIVKELVTKCIVKGSGNNKSVTFARYIPGVDGKRAKYVRWPRKEKPQDEEAGPDDTLRADVEEKTFLPTLTRPPMPRSVIDELRNKYSKFRTRHDPEYIAAKMEEDRLAEEKKRSVKQMRTPLKEANLKERKARQKLGKGHLTPDMMMRIGQMIAARRDPRLNAMAVQSVGAARVVA